MLQLDKYEVVPILLTFVGIGSVAVLLSLVFYSITCKTVPSQETDVVTGTIEYDGCEYLEYSPNRGSSYRCLTHKGNCKYCAKRNGK
jgi:hypothetical protein